MLQFFKSSLSKVKKALGKTHSFIAQRLHSLLGKPWDEETFEALERILYEADLGSICTHSFLNYVRSELRLKPTHTVQDILPLFRTHALSLLHTPSVSNVTPPPTADPQVILVVGVNGSGKTTSIAKLALHFQSQGKKVLLAAADTFRAAAVEQLTLWAERLQCEIVKGSPGADPSAVVFDALSAAKARGVDLVLVDTAGRLQNKKDLMQELEKIRRVCTKVITSAPHQTLLVLDATTGQNALDQATLFHEVTPLTGICLAKLDGSAKGGIIFAIYQQLKIPVLWIGTGENLQDLEPFEPMSYVEALFGE